MSLFSKIALRNLWKNKRRSLATGLSIAVGFAGLCLLGGYILRTEKFLRINSIYVNHSGHLAVYKKDSLELFYNNPLKYQLTGSELKQIQEILADETEVEFTAPILLGMGFISNDNKSVPFMGYGVIPADEMKIQNHPLVKQWTHELVPPSGEASIKDATGDLAETVSVTKELGTLLGKAAPFYNLSQEMKEVQLTGRTFDGDLNAVNAMLGFKHTTGYAMMEDTGFIAPLPLLQSLYATDGATYLAVYLKPDSSVGSALDRVQKKISDQGLDYEVFPFNDDRISLFYVGTMGFLFIMAGFFVVLIFGAVALSITNSMSIGIVERVREIGTMRTLGFTDVQITRLFTIESLYLTLISLSVGLLLAKGTAFLTNSVNIRFYPPGISGDMQFILTPETWFCLTLAVPILIICITCAYYVSKKQVIKPIVELLQQAN